MQESRLATILKTKDVNDDTEFEATSTYLLVLRNVKLVTLRQPLTAI